MRQGYTFTDGLSKHPLTQAYWITGQKYESNPLEDRLAAVANIHTVHIALPRSHIA